MKIIYKKGDMFLHVFPEGQCKVFAHGCNLQGVMGSGVAKQIKEKYPWAYEIYKQGCNEPFSNIGDVYPAFYLACDDAIIYNCITQEYFGRDKNTVYVDYYALRKCMQFINEESEYDSKVPEVVMPKIGAGLANGDWDIISKIIEEESTYFQPIVYEL